MRFESGECLSLCCLLPSYILFIFFAKDANRWLYCILLKGNTNQIELSKVDQTLHPTTVQH